ncbi:MULTISPECIES: hypothetical protein [Bacillus cereus group]|uniref:DUF2726 domain-containing protein n=1 Tax=Bacillus cereus TaxID=1396 RepID=A0A9X6ZHQ4_BACCE|nr:MULTISPECIES: hypothetical protein [Bacillus cereus group]PFF51825.1 hypothetical protein CN357_03795 [Bacillus cereus]PFQ27749.1 hypothetical protein COK33_31615 [Bacillus cereus]PGB10050.1 hypothetical protein COM09_23550 [Bacillus toyonensis]
MPRGYQKTHEDFLREVKEKRGNEYTILGVYKKASELIRIRHDNCDYEWDVQPRVFLKSKRCPNCYGKIKKTTILFKEEIKDLVGDEYEVLGEYQNSKTHLLIKHNRCGREYYIRPNDFISLGARCSFCAGNIRKSHEDYVREIDSIYGSEYSVIGQYISNSNKIKIRHNKCEYEWSPRADGFLQRKATCPECTKQRRRLNKLKTHQEFKREIADIYGDEYTLLSEYQGSRVKITVRHKKCNHIFDLNPDSLLVGSVCIKCNSSKGEQLIMNYLESKNIEYEKEYTFDDCIYKGKLRFDFAVFKENKIVTLIEFDGIQHMKPVEHFGGEESFRKRQIKDRIKDEYCILNELLLIRISYKDFNKNPKNIERILNKKLLPLMK